MEPEERMEPEVREAVEPVEPPLEEPRAEELCEAEASEPEAGCLK